MLSRQLLIALVLACLAPACSQEEPARPADAPTQLAPEEIATRFLSALQSDDETAILALVTEGARAAISGDDGVQLSGSAMESFTVRSAVVDGNRAEVPVDVVELGESQERALLLRRESRGWRVQGVRVAFGEGSITLDFEEAAGVLEGVAEELGNGLQEAFEGAFEEMEQAWSQGGTPEQIAAARARFEAIDATSVEAHDQAWQVDVRADGRPALDVLTELLATTGVAIDAGEPGKPGKPGKYGKYGKYGDALAQPLDLALNAVSRAEAVEQIARAVGLHAVWPDESRMQWSETKTKTLAFGAGPRPLPVHFSGPFAIEITRVDEDAPNAVGELVVTARALGLAPGVLAFQPDSSETLRIEAVDDGADTSFVDADVQYSGPPTIEGGYFAFSLGLDLRGLLSSVESIARVRGEVRLPIATAVEPAALKPSNADDFALGAWQVEVGAWGEETKLVLRADEDVESVELRMSPLRAGGNPLGTLWQSAWGWNSEIQASIQCPEAPDVLDLKLCTVETLAYGFELENVPLVRFREQPLRLTELEFSGPAPVRVELLELTPDPQGQWPTRLSIQNASNKDVRSALVRFRYLDASGTELEDFPHTLTGDYDFAAERIGALVTAGHTTEVETFAAFVPEGTRSIAFSVLQLEFPDGTVWESDER